jgi:hypothetical protein
MLSRSALVSLLLSIAALMVACTKSESDAAGPAPTADPAPRMTASPAASSAVIADPTSAPAVSASADPSPDAAATTAGAVKAPLVAATATESANAGADECGKKPLPDCPLQGWMKQNMNPPSLAGDTAALAVALEKSAKFAPAGYTNWASISNDGAKAAKSGDLSAAKASCRSCHDQYKKKYQAEMRARKI